MIWNGFLRQSVDNFREKKKSLNYSVSEMLGNLRAMTRFLSSHLFQGHEGDQETAHANDVKEDWFYTGWYGSQLEPHTLRNKKIV